MVGWSGSLGQRPKKKKKGVANAEWEDNRPLPSSSPFALRVPAQSRAESDHPRGAKKKTALAADERRAKRWKRETDSAIAHQQGRGALRAETAELPLLLLSALTPNPPPPAIFLPTSQPIRLFRLLFRHSPISRHPAMCVASQSGQIRRWLLTRDRPGTMGEESERLSNGWRGDKKKMAGQGIAKWQKGEVKSWTFWGIVREMAD